MGISLARFILRRSFLQVFVLFGVTLLTFFLMFVVPGDPAVLLAETGGFEPEVIEDFRRRWGFDKPPWQQYLRYMGNLLRGNLGISLVTKVPVSEQLGTVSARHRRALRHSLPDGGDHIDTCGDRRRRQQERDPRPVHQGVLAFRGIDAHILAGDNPAAHILLLSRLATVGPEDSSRPGAPRSVHRIHYDRHADRGRLERLPLRSAPPGPAGLRAGLLNRRTACPDNQNEHVGGARPGVHKNGAGEGSVE